MLPFSTEFPVSPKENKATFIAEIIAWLRGTDYSTVLGAGADADLANENVHIQSSSGEELRLRELVNAKSWDAIGFRHDVPDNEGRLWRTEGVIRRGAAESEQDLIRLRTQCLAKVAGARLDDAKKPYLIKALLKNSWGGLDGRFQVSDQPIWLKDKGDGLATAAAVILGKATHWLPVLYFSATSKNAWSIGKQQIEKIAYHLGGVAHVVIEPDRAFSFKLREVSEAKNPYGGAVALILPNQGVVKRFHLGWQNQNSEELSTAIKRATVGLRGRMPSIGWDWTELQEQALRAHRIREKNRLTTEENERLYQEEIENLLDRIQQLEAVINASSIPTDEDSSFNDISLGSFIKKIGPEIYSGEISDRVRLAAKISISVSDNIGLDKRSKAILTKILENVPASSSLSAIRQDLGSGPIDFG